MGISWIDKRQLINFVFLGQFFFWGCSSVKVPVYPEPILLDQNPVVFVRYAYDEIQFNLSVKVVDGNPTAYKLGIYKVQDMDSPLLSRIFFPGETMSVILPSNLLSVEDSGNVVIVVPQGDDFEIIKHFFKIDGPGQIDFPLANIRINPAVLTGIVSERIGDIPVGGAHVQIWDSSGVVSSTITNSSGDFIVELRSTFKDRNDLYISVSSDDQYPIWKNTINFQGLKLLTQNVILGPSLLFLKQGMVYRVIQNKSPLREGPENGSQIKFFLSRGDYFVVEKVAGELLFGRIEIPIDNNKKFEQFEGWVQNKNLEFIQ